MGKWKLQENSCVSKNSILHNINYDSLKQMTYRVVILHTLTQIRPLFDAFKVFNAFFKITKETIKSRLHK